jgi:hypothetical protein
MDLILQNIDPIAVKKIDEIEKKKRISRHDFFKSRPKKEGGTEREKGS